MATARHRSIGYGKLTSTCHGVAFNAQEFKYMHSLTNNSSIYTQWVYALKSVWDGRKEFVTLQGQLQCLNIEYVFLAKQLLKARQPLYLQLNWRNGVLFQQRRKNWMLQSYWKSHHPLFYEWFKGIFWSNYDYTQFWLICSLYWVTLA